MKEVLKKLNLILKESESIIKRADEIALLREQIVSEEDLLSFVFKVKDRVQKEAMQAVINNDGRGLIAMATGSGKSKVAIDLVKYYSSLKKSKIYDCNSLVVPTEKLRDENWKEEFEKWNATDVFDKTERLCYASASKIENRNINLLTLDEAHNLTELSSEIFTNNNVEHVIAMTATLPDSDEKKELFNRLHIPVVYVLTLDDAVKLGLVAPYKISVVYTTLDEINKTVLSGSKANPFYQTEAEKYKYLSTVFNNAPNYSQDKFRATMNRMRFIYNLKSKFDAASFILKKLIPETDRSLIFCGSIEQANEINPHKFHSKSSDADYNAFKLDKIKKLSCVQSINEGHNFIGIDSALVVQINSKEKDIIQRIGRAIRYRPGHEAHIWIIVCKGTQDELWASSALENLNQDKIEYINFETLRTAC